MSRELLSALTFISTAAGRKLWVIMKREYAVGLNNQLPQVPASLPEWIPLVPAGGVVTGRDGRRFKNPGPDRLVAAFTERGLHIPIDINHAQELKAPLGDPSPAYGWVVELAEKEGALLGRIEWNGNGKAALEAGEYRYYSPAYRLSKDGEILYVKSVGLTNSPNLEVPGLNSESGEEGGERMDKILKALGLNADADEAAVLSAIGKLQTANNASNGSGGSGGIEMVPKADYQLALNRAQEAENALAEREKMELNAEAKAAIDGAIAARKIAPASRDYYAAQCTTREGLNAFNEFVKTAPEVVSGTSVAPAGSAADTKELNAEEAEIARQLGLNEEEENS